MATNVLLSVGDGNVTDDFDIGQYIVEQGISAPPPAEGDRTRTIALALELHAADADALWTVWGNVEKKLNQARRARGPYGLGSGVTLSVQLDTTEWVYFDVLDGALELANLGILSFHAYATLSLVCLPFGRGDAYTAGPSSTLTNGTGATYTISDVPGDTDALVRLTISDVSTNSKIINRLRIGRRSLPDGVTSSDFTGVVDETAVSPGASSAEAGTIGGNRSRVTTSGSWQSVAAISKPAAQYSVGLFNVLVRARDSAIYPGIPFDVEATIAAGASTLLSGTHQFRIVALDASNRISAASEIVTVFIPTTNAYRVNFTWTVPTNGSTVADHRLYTRVNSGTWNYKATSSASGSYLHSAASGFTPADPPTIPSNHPSQLRLQIGLSSGTTTTPTKPVYMSLSNSQWELVDLGTHPLPPQQAVEAGTPLDWRAVVQALNTSGTPTVDIDGAWLIPADEAATLVYVDGLSLGTKRDWIIDTRRDGAVTAYRVQTGTSTEAGGLVTSAPFTLGPGDNVLTFAADITNGVSDITDAKFTVAARIVPRYRALGGS